MYKRYHVRSMIIIGVILAIFLSSISFKQVSATEVTYIDQAQDLQALGLYLGTLTELSSECDRLSTAVILARFLGKENEIKNSNLNSHFTDVQKSYANKYIAYLFKEDLIKGISPDKYGTGKMSINDFVASLLKVLGYSPEIDFKENNTLLKLKELKIIPDNYYSLLKAKKKFLKNDAVYLCYLSLFANCKGSEHSLVYKMLWDDVFTTGQLGDTLNGKLMLSADMPDLIPSWTVVYSKEELRDLIMLSLKNNQLGIGIDTPTLSESEAREVYDSIVSQYHWKALLHPSATYTYTSTKHHIYPHINISDYLMMEYYYSEPKRFKKNWKFYREDLITDEPYYKSMPVWVKRLDDIVNKCTTSDMNEYEKVKALHNYLILNTKYDATYENNAFMTPHFAISVLFEGHGVCDGYAEAFKILLNAAGIECKVMYGTTPYGNHAWNQVNIDDQWYNLDVTWDDPDNSNLIGYDYFLKDDKEFSKEHIALDVCKPEVCDKNYPQN